MCGKEVKRPQLSSGSTARDPTPAHSSVGIEIRVSSVNCSMASHGSRCVYALLER